MKTNQVQIEMHAPENIWCICTHICISGVQASSKIENNNKRCAPLLGIRIFLYYTMEPFFQRLRLAQYKNSWSVKVRYGYELAKSSRTTAVVEINYMTLENHSREKFEHFNWRRIFFLSLFLRNNTFLSCSFVRYGMDGNDKTVCCCFLLCAIILMAN